VWCGIVAHKGGGVCWGLASIYIANRPTSLRHKAVDFRSLRFPCTLSIICKRLLVLASVGDILGVHLTGQDKQTNLSRVTDFKGQTTTTACCRRDQPGSPRCFLINHSSVYFETLHVYLIVHPNPWLSKLLVALEPCMSLRPQTPRLLVAQPPARPGHQPPRHTA
jgi:hypothetical protein